MGRAINCLRCQKPARLLRAEDYEAGSKTARFYFCKRHGEFWSLEKWVPDGVVKLLASEQVLAELGAD